MQRHALDPFSLVAGLAFLAIGLVFLLGDADLAVRLAWVWPILLVSAGLGLLLKLVVPDERHEAGAGAGQPALEPPATDPLSDHATIPGLEPLPDAELLPDAEPLPDAGTEQQPRRGLPRQDALSADPDPIPPPDRPTDVLEGDTRSPDPVPDADRPTDVLEDDARDPEDGPDPDARTEVVGEAGSPDERGPGPLAGPGRGPAV